MRPKRPPRLASLLLNRLTDNPPLAGDLEEEYAAGRSAAWYWRQVLLAVFVRPRRDFDMHAVFAVQGLPMQVIMLTLVSICAVFTVKLIAVYVLQEPVFQSLIGPRGIRELLRLTLSFAIAIPTGIVIARIHAESRRVAVLVLSVIVPLWAFANVYVLNGRGNLDSALPHVLALLVFIAGLLSGGVHVDPLMHSRQMRPSR